MSDITVVSQARQLEQTCQACKHFRRTSCGVGGVCTRQAPKYSVGLGRNVYEPKNPESEQCNEVELAQSVRVKISVELGFDAEASDLNGRATMAYADIDILAKAGKERLEAGQVMSRLYPRGPWFQVSVAMGNQEF